VIPYGTWVPVAVRRVANCYIRLLYYSFTLLLLFGAVIFLTYSFNPTLSRRMLATLPDIGRTWLDSTLIITHKPPANRNVINSLTAGLRVLGWYRYFARTRYDIDGILVKNTPFSKTQSPYHFLIHSVKKWIDFNNFRCTESSKKFHRNRLSICPPHRLNVAALPCEMQNSFTWSKLYCFPEKVDGFENSRLLCCIAT